MLKAACRPSEGGGAEGIRNFRSQTCLETYSKEAKEHEKTNKKCAKAGMQPDVPYVFGAIKGKNS